MSHIDLARWPDCILIAPATAHVIAKLAHGFADDLLSTLCLASEARLIIVPAMNQVMWFNQATQDRNSSGLQCIQLSDIKFENFALSPAFRRQSTSFPVILSAGSHPFPSRTRKLSLLEPMILQFSIVGK